MNALGQRFTIHLVTSRKENVKVQEAHFRSCLFTSKLSPTQLVSLAAISIIQNLADLLHHSTYQISDFETAVR